MLYHVTAHKRRGLPGLLTESHSDPLNITVLICKMEIEMILHRGNELVLEKLYFPQETVHFTCFKSLENINSLLLWWKNLHYLLLPEVSTFYCSSLRTNRVCFLISSSSYLHYFFLFYLFSFHPLLFYRLTLCSNSNFSQICLAINFDICFLLWFLNLLINFKI